MITYRTKYRVCAKLLESQNQFYWTTKKASLFPKPKKQNLKTFRAVCSIDTRRKGFIKVLFLLAMVAEYITFY